MFDPHSSFGRHEDCTFEVATLAAAVFAKRQGKAAEQHCGADQEYRGPGHATEFAGLVRLCRMLNPDEGWAAFCTCVAQDLRGMGRPDSGRVVATRVCTGRH